MPDPNTSPIRVSLFELSITGLLQRIGQIFEFRCNFVTGGYDRRAEAKVEGEITYPYGNLRLNSVEQRPDYNRTATKKYGIKTHLDKSGHYWYKFHGSAVIATLSLRMVFGDQQDLFKMIHNYFIRENHFSFTLQSPETGLELQHNVTRETQISVPEIEESEYGNNLPFETSLRLNTWIGELYQIPNIQKIRGQLVPTNSQELPDITGVEVPATQFFEIANLQINPILPVSSNS